MSPCLLFFYLLIFILLHLRFTMFHLHLIFISLHLISSSFHLRFILFHFVSLHVRPVRFCLSASFNLMSFHFVSFHVVFHSIPIQLFSPYLLTSFLLLSFIRFIPGHFQFHSSSIHSCSTNNIHLLPPSFLAPSAR